MRKGGKGYERGEKKVKKRRGWKRRKKKKMVKKEKVQKKVKKSGKMRGREVGEGGERKEVRERK